VPWSGIALYNLEPEALDLVFENFACYRANKGDFQEVLQQVDGEPTSFSRALE
jgi:predicted nucleic-acid-binding protein